MKVAAIVSGHSEVYAVPILLRRLAERFDIANMEVPKPFRLHEGKLKNDKELERAIRISASKVEPDGGLLVLLDADDVCPAKEAPALLARARASANGIRLELVMARREYETWFLAAATSLAGKRTLPDDLAPPRDAEAIRDAKGWLDERMSRGYSPTVDQPAFTSQFDIDAALEASASFAKLLRAAKALLGVGS